MLKFRTPDKVYFKKGCLPVALRELKEVYSKKNVLILVDDLLADALFAQQIADRLHEMQINYAISEYHTEWTLLPDCIIAYGSDADLESIAKQISALLEKPYYITIPAYLGNYRHVMPLPDGNYPDMTIVEPDMMRKNPEVVKMALARALDALASENATDYSDSLAIRAVLILLNAEIRSAEQLANAGTLAGFAFENAKAEKDGHSGKESVCAEKLGISTKSLLKGIEAIVDKFNF